MVDAPQTPAPIADVPAAAPSPAAEISAPAPVTEAPSAEPAPAPVVEPVKETPATDAPVENILGDEKTKDEVKSDASKTDTKDAAKPEGEKATTETPPEVKVELPVYDEFKLPENYTADKESLEGFTKILGEIESGKLDHAGYQDMGQKLVDLGTKAVADSIARLNEYYTQYHNDAIKARLTAMKADPEMGGENFQKTVSVLQDAVGTYGGTPEQVAEFRKEITESGLYASPSLCRLLLNMQQKINKYTTEADNGNGGNNRIVPAAKPAPSKVKDYQRFYGTGNAS